jgi:hypothetical protein
MIGEEKPEYSDEYQHYKHLNNGQWQLIHCRKNQNSQNDKIFICFSNVKFDITYNSSICGA